MPNGKCCANKAVPGRHLFSVKLRPQRQAVITTPKLVCRNEIDSHNCFWLWQRISPCWCECNFVWELCAMLFWITSTSDVEQGFGYCDLIKNKFFSVNWGHFGGRRRSQDFQVLVVCLFVSCRDHREQHRVIDLETVFKNCWYYNSPYMQQDQLIHLLQRSFCALRIGFNRNINA